MDLVYTALLVAAMLLGVAAGWWIRRRLHERHLSRDSVESVRLLMGMLLTFAALVLGLLTSNAKARFDGLSDGLGAFATDLIELDRRLRAYGPGADDIRGLLRAYTAAAIADSWPDEPGPAGDYPRLAHDRPTPGIEGRRLGDMLAEVEVRIDGLEPGDGFHRLVASRLRDGVAASIRQRWRLILSSRSTLPWPFLLTLASWLSIVFAIFGMTSPPGRVVYAAAALAALSIASPLYLIINYDEALNRSFGLSSGPMRAALLHMDAAPR